MNTDSGSTSTSKLRADYERDDVVCVRDVISLDWLETLCRATDAALANPGPLTEAYGDPDKPLCFGDLDVWMRVGDFKDYVLSSPAARICGEVVGSSTARFFYDQLLVKEVGCADRTPWHQDQPYWAVKGR